MSIIRRIIMGSNYRPSERCYSPPPMDGFSDRERAKVENAWAMAESAPNAHLLTAVHSMSKGNGAYGASAGGRHVTIDSVINSSPREIASALIHEAAHCYHKHGSSTPDTERQAVEEENKARAALGLGLKNPNDFSWHAANGYGARETQHAQTSTQPDPRKDPVSYWQWRLDNATSWGDRSSCNYRLHEETVKARKHGG